MQQKTQFDISVTGNLIRKSTETFTFSKKYINVMVQCAVFNIICNRVIIQKEEIESKKYEDECFFVIAKLKKVNDPKLNMFVKWLIGIKDAINKNYLKNIYLHFKENNDLYETYSLTLKYNNVPNHSNPDKKTPNYVKDATKALLHAISGLSKIQKLDDNVTIEIEFTYTEDTPRDYEPPGFHAVSAQEANCFKYASPTVLMATISTGFHKLSARSSELKLCDTPAASTTEEVIEDVPEEAETNAVIDSTQSSRKRTITQEPDLIINLDNDEPVKETDEPEVKRSGRRLVNISNITVSEMIDDTMDSTDSDPPQIVSHVTSDTVHQCICKLPVNAEFVSCTKCTKQCHAPCYGIIGNNKKEPIEFTCIDCGTTDQLLKQNDPVRQILFVKFRLILYFKLKQDGIPKVLLNSLNEAEVETLMSKLKDLGVITKGSTDLAYSYFNRRKLQELQLTFFPMSDDSQFLSI